MAMLSICSKEELSGAEKDDDGIILFVILLLKKFRLGSQETDYAKQDQGYRENGQSIRNAQVRDFNSLFEILKMLEKRRKQLQN